MRTEEDDEFERIQNESGWRKRQVATTIQVPDLYRNYIIDEIAEQLEKINHNTGKHYAEFIRKLKR